MSCGVEGAVGILVVYGACFRVFITVHVGGAVFIGSVISMMVSSQYKCGGRVPSEIGTLNVFGGMFFGGAGCVIRGGGSTTGEVGRMVGVAFKLGGFGSVYGVECSGVLFCGVSRIACVLCSVVSGGGPSLVYREFRRKVLSCGGDFPSSSGVGVTELLEGLLRGQGLLRRVLRFCYFAPTICRKGLKALVVPPVRDVGSSSIARFLSLFTIGGISDYCGRGCVCFSDICSFRNNRPVKRLSLIGGVTRGMGGRGLVMGIRPHSGPREFVRYNLGMSLGSRVP